jgi:tetratricopeptide (TPR) repeat protein
MNKLSLFFSIIILTAVSVYLFQNQYSIVQKEDYQQYLTDEYIKKEKLKINSNITFWQQKLFDQPHNYVFEKKIAQLLAHRFKVTGNPDDLAQSDSLLLIINKRIPNQVSVLQLLAANAITQHQFTKAEAYITEAYLLGEKRYTSALYLTDVLMERGQFYAAKSQLKQLNTKQQFDFLIRDVKLQDQEGDLTKAIETMEKALVQAMASGNRETINWSLSNLADMYGHDGQIRKSYETYLEALEYHPADLHALKGIAWVAFSHDKDTNTAKHILNQLSKIHPTPEYDLLLAEIAAFENEEDKVMKFEQAFVCKLDEPIYRKMYQTHLANMAEDNSSIKIAQSEVEDRPHPMSYDLLAWSYYQNQNIDKAVQIVQQKVINKTEEPTALFHSGLIFKSAGQSDLAFQYLSEALDAAYELGPVITEKIKHEIATL